jgi:hypothetical protein
LAAKANESGGGLFGPGAGGGNILGSSAKPQFGSSPFSKANVRKNNLLKYGHEH